MRRGSSTTLEGILLQFRLCKSATEISGHHSRYPIPHLFTGISSLSTPIARHPVEEFDTQYDNSIRLHRFSHVLQEGSNARDLRAGMLAHAQLLKLAPNGFLSLWNKVLGLYALCGHTRLLRFLFETMPERNVVSFNTMISSYFGHNRNSVRALQVFSKMQEEDVKPDRITLSALIRASVLLNTSHLIELFHAQVIQYGLSSNEFVGSALVDGYAKKRRLECALRAFDEIAELDLVSWNIMIDACTCNDSKDHALRIFSRMRKEGARFDGFTLTSITKTCSEPRDLELGLQLHGCIVKAGLTSETPIANALITMYAKCEEGMVSATQVFQRMFTPNIISWTAMIAGLMQKGQNEEAVRFYRRMLRVGVKENEFSFASILPVYSNLASLEQGRQVHARVIKSWVGLDLLVQNGLVDMYSKCGSLADAQLVFMTMENRDLISWTVMITGFGQHGRGREALNFFEAMTNEGLKPDAVTFLGCLSACSHSGLVDEGLQVFRSMIEVYGVKPKREHYACIVDMFGRSGRLKDAERFIEDTGIKSDALAWEALLGACRIHGEMALGKRSAERIMELEPEKHGPYMLLSNMYADRGLWDDKGKLRERFCASGLKKETGHSWVALQGTL